MEKTIVKEIMKKSIFSAKSQFEYKKLIFPEPYLIKMTLEEEKEELILSYEMEDRKSVLSIRTEDMLTVLAVLMNIEQLREALKKYCFSMNPDNLYYDINRQVSVKVRDVYPDGRGYEEKDFLDNYKALAGFALQKKYSYDDYKKGGKKLLSKNILLNKIKEAENAQAIKTILCEEYERVEAERIKKKILLNKGTFHGLRIAVIALSILCITTISYAGYQFIKVTPLKNAIIDADNAYIETDYVSCIDAMRGVGVSDMEVHQKFILANSYIRSENLTQEQKTNILETISLSDSAIRLEYWIYLGRGDTDEAVDIAMQQSDDQLLLYAYMKKKASIESDAALSGEEKTQQLKDISSLMEPLMEQYDTEEN
ncbi:MAG: type VII secretion protein EssB/YukC [Lachnotalea sp.]